MNQPTYNTDKTGLATTWYLPTLLTAGIAAVFSVIVCVLMVDQNLDRSFSPHGDPTDLIPLKKQLAANPKDETIKEEIRTTDLQLRTRDFSRRSFTAKGAWLLLGGLAVFFISLKTALEFRKRLPMPRHGPDNQELYNRQKSLAFKTVCVLTLIIAGVSAWLVIRSGPPLTSELLLTASPGQPTEPAEPVLPYPTPEEISQNWPRFRGPGGLGISNYDNIPTFWHGLSGEGILWKSPIPLPGENSPVVWQDKVFITGATEDKREVYCYNNLSGELLWQKEVRNPGPSATEIPDVMEETGYAAPTATTDGRRVYAIFANGDLISFDFAGNRIWGRNLGIPQSAYGFATSLTMYQDKLIVQYDQATEEDGLSKIMAFEGPTGKIVWQQPRPVANSWATPIVINHNGSYQIITCANPLVIAYDPATGNELWKAECLYNDVAPSQVYNHGLVLAVSPERRLYAIRPDGKGDVTKTHVAWVAKSGVPDTCSPLATDELVFLLTSYGRLTCYDIKDGTKLWEQALEEDFNASPSLAGSNIYLVTTEGVTIIFAAAREYQEITRLELGEEVNASPAFQNGRIYIRAKENLYCIGNHL
ncbi:MAG: PQQ-binding-like beta-propeller repeat protein [Sedimentisphaerales bacterium]|nr:PQQ-binding-like beta-propeller repeat protein [Sedimentisphaerales bacterium]